MKSAKEENVEEKVEKTIVVGVKIGDEDSTKILTWALLNTAKPGDQVIALNILHSSSKSGPDGKSSSSSIVKGLESILAAYGGFCNLRHIDLKMKVCKGSSMRRILVKEMHSLGATQLILGAAKIRRRRCSGIGSAVEFEGGCCHGGGQEGRGLGCCGSGLGQMEVRFGYGRTKEGRDEV